MEPIADPTAKTVLIVDDELAELEILADTLSQEGIRVLTAQDGEAGLKLAIEKQPDLILLDILMPKMDGLEMLKRLRENEWGKEAQVLLLTNLSDFEKFMEAIERGVHDYMIKSDWKLEEIINKVKVKLGLKTPAQNSTSQVAN